MHTLPDGQSITIESEGQQVAQAILTPMLLKKDLPDLPAAVVTQIMQHPDGATRKVYSHGKRTHLKCRLPLVFAAALLIRICTWHHADFSSDTATMLCSILQIHPRVDIVLHSFVDFCYSHPSDRESTCLALY